MFGDLSCFCHSSVSSLVVECCFFSRSHLLELHTRSHVHRSGCLHVEVRSLNNVFLVEQVEEECHGRSGEQAQG